MKRLLGLFLHIANSSPPIIGRKEFYELKTRLLKRWGRLVANDWQHIVKECWNCEGRGTIGCYRCRTYGMGDGIWDEFYVWLERWKLGNYEFHIPRERIRSGQAHVMWGAMAAPIEGYITHKRYPYYLSSECWYWLLIFFQPSLFWSCFGHAGHVCRKYTPLVILGTWLFHLDMLRERQARHGQFRESDTDRLIRDIEEDRLAIKMGWYDEVPF